MTPVGDAPIGVLIVGAIMGIILAAVLSAGEVAIVAVSRSAVADLSARKPHKAQRLQRLTENSQQVAAVASFTRVVAEMVATACITVALSTVVSRWWIVVVLAVVSSALIALLLVRISPRTLGRHNPAGVLSAVSAVLSATWMVLRWIAPMTKAARIPATVDDENELREFVDRVEESEVIEEDEREMLRSVIELHDTRLSEVMVPRTDIVSVEASEPLRRAQNVFVRSGFSRIPVVGESSDEVLGVLFFKDAARVLLNSQDPDSKRVADVMRPVKYYPEMKRADDLLREMQATRQHIAMAIDEYGGIAGMVTIEDIVEEIVGELVDEHDNEAPGVELISEGLYRVPARMSLDDVGELFDIELEDPDVDTVAGLFSKALGKIPLVGAVAETHGIRIAADGFAGRRKQLSSVLVEKLDDEDNHSSQPEQNGEAHVAAEHPSDQFGSGQTHKEK